MPRVPTVLVCRTSVKCKKDLKCLKAYLDRLGNQVRWNCDLTDRDRVLRVETEVIAPGDIIGLLREAGFFCQEFE